MAASLVAACGQRSTGHRPGPHEPPPIVATAPTSAPQATAGGSADASSFDVPRVEPLATSALVLAPGAPFDKKNLTGQKRIGRGVVVPPGIPLPNRIAIATGTQGTLVDAQSGSVIAKLPANPEYVAPGAGVITLSGSPPRLVRLRDGQIITPQLDAGGQKLRSAWLAASMHQPVALALGKSDSGQHFAGVPSGDLTRFVLQPLPIAPAVERVSAVLNAFGGWQIAANDRGGVPWPLAQPGGACVVVQLDQDGKVKCIEVAAPGTASGHHADRWMADGWFSGSDYAKDYVSHVSWGGRRIDFASVVPNGQCVARATHASPPRIALTCRRGVPALLWMPGKLLSFRGPRDPNGLGGLLGADSGQILPIREEESSEDETADSAAIERWLDLRAPRLVSTPKLRPLAIAPFAGVERRALAEQKNGKNVEVYLLDFERLTRRVIATISDCPGVLAELDDLGASPRHRVLTCLTPQSPHAVTQALIWSEIIDLEAQLRLRTVLLPEALFSDGLVVLSTRRVLAAETRPHAGEIFSYRLPTR